MNNNLFCCISNNFTVFAARITLAKLWKKIKDTSKIDTDKMYAPSFLMVLVGTGLYAYRRDDGVLVVPIGSLTK